MEKVPCYVRLQQGIDTRGIKQADLCSMTGISKSTMSQYFKGLYEPSQVKIDLIARALDVNEAWLMGYDVQMERKQPTPAPEDGLSDSAKKLLDIIRQLDEDTQKRLLVAAQVYLDSRDKTAKNP